MATNEIFGKVISSAFMPSRLSGKLCKLFTDSFFIKPISAIVASVVLGVQYGLVELRYRAHAL